MTNWKTYQGQTPWDLTPVASKIIYNEGDKLATIADSVWHPPGQGNDPITPEHAPCGYWSKDYVIPSSDPGLPCDWEEVAPQYGDDTVNRPSSLIVYNDEIYASSYGLGYTLLKWNGINAWIGIIAYASTNATRSLATLGNYLYGLGANCNLNKWDGESSWTRIVTNTTYYSPTILISYNGKLYTYEGSPSSVQLLEWDGVTSWVSKGAYAVADAETVADMIVYNDDLYLNTVAGLLVWNGTDTLTKIADYISGDGGAGHCVVYNNSLYMTKGKYLYLLDGSQFVLQSGEMSDSENSLDIIDYEGKLLICGSSTGGCTLWLYEESSFTEAALTDVNTVNTLCLYNGRLFSSGDKVDNTNTGILWRWTKVYS